MKPSLLLAFALLVTSLCSITSAAPGSIHFTAAEVSQALQLYRDLTGLKLVVDSRVTKTGRTVAIRIAASEREEAAKLIEKALLEQTGTVITRLDQERASVTYNDALPITPANNAPAAKGTLSVALQESELGAGWGERKVVFAIDPLEQPAEFVNAFASRNPTNRASIVRDVRKALSANGSAGMAEIWYGHSGDYLEVVISRYPDQEELDKRWEELSAKFDATAVAPKVGQSAAWLDTGAGGTGRMFVFRQGLFTGWITCKAALSGEPLLELAKATAGKMARIAEPATPPNAAPPHR